ncbi:MAG: DUF5127 domain-containing protein, partial [Marinilabiliaceae bacterium]
MMNLRYFYPLIILFFFGITTLSCTQDEQTPEKKFATEIRAPAYPLVTVDPYMSAWSHTDTLYNDPVRHWTNEIHGLVGAIRVDDEVYRFLGKEEKPWVTLVPMAKEHAWEGKYMLEEPYNNWVQTEYDDSNWKTGKGAFGTADMPALSTPWETEDIWVRRDFTLPELDDRDVYLRYSHDDIFELYLNGEKLVETGYEWRNDVVLKVDRHLLNENGKNVIAAHCHNRTGGGYVDFGLYQIDDSKLFFDQTAVQNSVKLSATQSHYNFTCGPVDLNLEFVSPLLPNNLDLLSRPVNYINYSVSSNDGNEHDVQVYFDATPQWAVDQEAQEVEITSGKAGDVNYLKSGTTGQPVLEKKGDDVRIDWGYFYLAARDDERKSSAICGSPAGRKNFMEQGKTVTG